MAWRNRGDLAKEFTDEDWRSDFSRLYSIRLFFNNCLVEDEYKLPKNIHEAIALTSEGERVRLVAEREYGSEDPDLLTMAVFLKFAHSDLLIDISECDFQFLQACLHTDVREGNIRYPWVFGRFLYDRYSDQVGASLNEIDPATTRALLAGSPKGVFQLDQILVGPYGIVQSQQKRFLPPTTQAPVWHCSDPSCQSLHQVRLVTGRPRVAHVHRYIGQHLFDAEGAVSEWHSFYKYVIDGGTSSFYDDMDTSNLPLFLANALTEGEIRRLLADTIDSLGTKIRSQLPVQLNENGSSLIGSGSDISSQLKADECLELLLIVSDEVILERLDYLIQAQEIKVPRTETRRSKPNIRLGGNWYQAEIECSSLGVRIVPRRSETRVRVAMKRLESAIRAAYAGSETDLQWLLRHADGDSWSHKLALEVLHEDPEILVERFLFTSKERLRRGLQDLRFGSFPSPASQSDEELLRERMLWKLGFRVGRYPEHEQQFDSRLERFRSAVDRWGVESESSREQIRGAGTNFFVSLEELLDRALSFSAWMLLNDHYLDTPRFVWNLPESRQVMCKYLNGRPVGGETLRLDAQGRNTLFPLIAGFGLLATLVDEIQSDGAADYVRDQFTVPDYVTHGRFGNFPFLHNKMLFDLDKESLERIKSVLKQATKSLETARVSEIRNRLGHGRNGFPSSDELLSMVEAIGEEVDELLQSGLLPTVYNRKEQRQDSHGRTRVVFANHRGEELRVDFPSDIIMPRDFPPWDEPQILVSAARLQDSREFLRFGLEEESPYEDLWSDYPRMIKQQGEAHRDVNDLVQSELEEEPAKP